MTPHWHAEHSEGDMISFQNKLEADILAHKWLDMALKFGFKVEGNNPWTISYGGHQAKVQVRECTDLGCSAPVVRRRNHHTARDS